MDEPIYSQDAERAFLGSLLISPDSIRSTDVDIQDFYIHRHRCIYDVMKDLARQGINCDIVTLMDKLENNNKIEEIGGPSYLLGLLNDTPSSLHIEDYGEIIKDKARRRNIINTATELVKSAWGIDPPDEAIIQAVQSLTQSISLAGGAKPINYYLAILYDEVEERIKNPTDVYGYSTGLFGLDKITGGMQPGEAFYIGGEPGIGKSILSVQLGMGMAENGYPGAIYSLEMLGTQLIRRSVSAIGKIPTIKLKTGNMDESDLHSFVEAIDKAGNLPVFISDESYLTTMTLRADLARLVALHGIKWFVLDYLYLLSDGSGKMEPTARTELLSSRIKLLCKEFRLAGITVNSVTKDGSDIRGSGQVKHDADVIAMLGDHIPDEKTSGVKHDNMRTLVFKKAREMAQPRRYLHLVKHDDYPAFFDFQPEPNAQRITIKDKGN